MSNIAFSFRQELGAPRGCGGAFANGSLALFVLVHMILAGCSTAEKIPPPPPAKPMEAAAPPAPPARPTTTDLLRQAAAKPIQPFEGEDWKSLFDGKTLTGWRLTEFVGRAEVQCESGLLVLNMGDPFTGINWTNEIPKINYEVAFDAMRVSGSDFFCGLTVPVRDSFCSLIVGGWGGSLLGISSLDGGDASENETTKSVG